MLSSLLLGLSACVSAQPPNSITVAAAASLAPVFDALQPRFETQTGITLTISYGSTGNLAEQIRNGGPFDLFASADARRVDELVGEALLDANTRTVFARGRLILVASPILSYTIDSLESLSEPAVAKIALANPNHAPYGLAAEQALERSGVGQTVESKLVYAESVRQAGQMVLSGNTAAGLIAASTAQSMNLPGVDLPLELYEPVLHVAAVHADSPNPELALEFIGFLIGPDGVSTLESFGLESPGH
jgi:molybdate transport system substrate-binding protein